jgi:hypothetical protein
MTEGSSTGVAILSSVLAVPNFVLSLCCAEYAVMAQFGTPIAERGGQCGPEKNLRCNPTQCCSATFWCGNEETHCSAKLGCLEGWGSCGEGKGTLMMQAGLTNKLRVGSCKGAAQVYGVLAVLNVGLPLCCAEYMLIKPTVAPQDRKLSPDGKSQTWNGQPGSGYFT